MPGAPDVDPNQFLAFVAVERLPYAFAILLIGWLTLTLTTRFIDDLAERFTERRLLFKRVKAMMQFIAYLVLGVLVAGVALRLEGNQNAVAAASGALVFGLSYAGKDLLASLMSGVILLLDTPFQVGDRVAFGGYYGEVTEIGLRSVRLVTLDDNLVTIPNSQFLTEAVASANSGALDCMVVVPFYIGAAEDFGRAQRILYEVAATSRYVFLDKPIKTVLNDDFLGERFSTIVRIKAYVFDARFEKDFVSDVTERTKRAFREAGIRTPDQVYRDLDVHGRETPEPPGA